MIYGLLTPIGHQPFSNFIPKTVRLEMLLCKHIFNGPFGIRRSVILAPEIVKSGRVDPPSGISSESTSTARRRAGVSAP